MCYKNLFLFFVIIYTGVVICGKYVLFLQFISVSLEATSDFNFLSVTGLFTSSTLTYGAGPPLGNAVSTSDTGAPIPGVPYTCSMVHQQMLRTPQNWASVYWIAPEEGSGCVNFM